MSGSYYLIVSVLGNLSLEASNNSFLPYNYQLPPDPRNEFSIPVSISSGVSSPLFDSFADWTETTNAQDSTSPSH